MKNLLASAEALTTKGFRFSAEISIKLFWGLFLFFSSVITLNSDVYAQNITVETVQKDKVLLATYCQFIVSRKMQLINSDIGKLPPEVKNSPQVLAISRRTSDEFDRLTLYLSPETTHMVSPSDQLSAILRAEADDQEVGNISSACPAYDSPGFKACDENMLATYPALGRIRRCNDLSWLPF